MMVNTGQSRSARRRANRAAAKRLGANGAGQARNVSGQNRVIQQMNSHSGAMAQLTHQVQKMRSDLGGGTSLETGGSPMPNPGVRQSKNMIGAGETVLESPLAKRIYSSLGSTDSGREWALVALHPCGEYVTTCDGIPDSTSGTVVTPGFRNRSKIGWDPAVFATPPTPTAPFQFDVQVVVLPIPEIDYVYRLAYQGTWSRWVSVRFPTTPNLPDGSSTTLDNLGIDEYRIMGRGTTIYFDAANLANQGTVTAAQVTPSMTQLTEDYGNLFAPGEQGGAGNFLGSSIYVPLSVDELEQQGANASTWNARDGIYVPQRFRQPVHDYVKPGFGQLGTIPNDTTPFAQVPAPVSGIVIRPTSNSDLTNGGMDFYHPVTPTWVAGDLAPEYLDPS